MISLLLPSIFLFIFGIFNLFGIRANLAVATIIQFVIGIAVFFLIRKIGWKFFRSNSRLFYWLFIGVLVVTYIIGLEVKGSRRWIDLGIFRFQGSEFFKIFFIMFFADYFARIRRGENMTVRFLASVFYFLLPTVIIFRQPDLGNAMVYGFIFITMLLFSPIPKKLVMGLLGFGTAMLPFSWLFLKEYQRHRILSFFQPQVEQQQNAYNMIQAMITVGSGNFLGRGLGLGTQSKLLFLPENQTDFAFSSLIEQFGFMGGMLILGLFATIFFLLYKRAAKFMDKDDETGKYTFLYVVGLLSFVFFQVFVNVGMNLGMLPIAGIALPFISYGGSMIVSLMIGFALVP